ncbi:MAG TPA: hypothetical protein VK111_06845 [Virgibacillus sp.]|nr:hypothetical protein [Virgibacillus sp.]
MKQYAVLRLLFAGFLLYIAWPYIPEMSGHLETAFWGIWLGLFFLFVCGNSATLLKITYPPVMEQERQRGR